MTIELTARLSPPPADREPEVDEPDELAHHLELLRARLLSDFPDADPRSIDASIERGRVRLAGARIPHFRVLLIEKQVRSELRRTS